MGKRGPAAKGEFTDKSAVLSTRISSELRAALEASVQKSGLTLSREIEHRLRRTFVEDEKIDEGFGSRRNRAVMKMVALMMQTVWRPDRPDADWLSDPWLFDQTVIRVVALFEALRPAGKVDMPAALYGDEFNTEDFHKAASKSWVAGMLHRVQNADASLPPGRGELSDLLKADLGDVANRSPVVVGDASLMRSIAEGIADETKPKKAERSKARSAKRRN